MKIGVDMMDAMMEKPQLGTEISKLPEAAKAQTRTYAYEIAVGSGATQRTFTVELSRPLQRDPNRPQESLAEQLRDVLHRGRSSDPSDINVISVRERIRLEGSPEIIRNRTPENLRASLNASMGDIFIRPVVRTQ